MTLRAVLDAEHAASVLTFNIEKLKHESAEIPQRDPGIAFHRSQTAGRVPEILSEERSPGGRPDRRADLADPGGEHPPEGG